MHPAAPPARALARRVLEIEADRELPQESGVDYLDRACEQLRSQMSQVVGALGYSTLLAHALVLAKQEDPVVEQLSMDQSGALEWGNQPELSSRARATEILLTKLIQLLITFLGETVTLRLLQNVWPELSIVDSNPGTEEN